jgi:hypothetical protein
MMQRFQQMRAAQAQAPAGAGGLGQMARGMYDRMGGPQAGPMQPPPPAQAPAAGPPPAPPAGRMPQQGMGGLGQMARGIYDRMGGQPRGPMQPAMPGGPPPGGVDAWAKQRAQAQALRANPPMERMPQGKGRPTYRAQQRG